MLFFVCAEFLNMKEICVAMCQIGVFFYLKLNVWKFHKHQQNIQ